MKIRIILIIIAVLQMFSLQYTYSQWESAGWKREMYLNTVLGCGGTIIRGQFNSIMTSSDLGNTWKKADGIEANIIDLAKNDNSVVVAASFSPAGVLLSSDCGLSWKRFGNEVSSDVPIFTIEISGDTIIAGSYSGANIYVSTDLGESWEAKNLGLHNSDEFRVNTIAFENETIFVCLGAKYTSALYNEGLYKSNDFGETWTYVGSETSKATEVFIHGNRVFVYSKGLKYSEDMGETWTPVTLGETVTTIKSNADKIYVGTHLGLYRSLDGGDTWSEYGSKKININAIDFIDDKILASSVKTLHIIEPSDEDWRLLDTLVDYGTVEKFAIKDGLIYAFTYATQILVSDDIGESWKSVNPITWIQKPNAFEAINDKLYLATSGFSLNSGGLQVSTDNGKSWQPDEDLAKFVEEIDQMPGKNLEVFSVAEHDSYIFMGTSVGILHSTDNGENWKIRPNNIDTVREEFSKVFQFLSFGEELFVRTPPLLSTTDYGETWIEKDLNGLPVGRRPSSISVVGNTLVSSFQGALNESGVYISKDRGNNWDYITKEYLMYNKKGTIDVGKVLAFDNYIFASTITSIANFITADEGKNWVPINEGLPDLKINDIKRVGDYLIAGTSGGFSRAKISDIENIIVIASVEEELPVAEQENTVYPNPTNAYLHIDKYEGSPMDYEIFDYAGKKVLTGTLNGYKIDVSALPAAAYIVVLSDETQKRTMKFIKK